MSWFAIIGSRGGHVNPPKWIVHGYYEEELVAYNTAQDKWEALQRLGGPYKKEMGKYFYHKDDYFSHYVIGPNWYLWTDGTWNKQQVNAKCEVVCEFDSELSASLALKGSYIPPAKFVDYVEHLGSAKFPWNVLNNEESVHNI